MEQEKSVRCSKGVALAKFLIFSGLGVFKRKYQWEKRDHHSAHHQFCKSYLRPGHPLLRTGNGGVRRSLSHRDQGIRAIYI